MRLTVGVVAAAHKGTAFYPLEASCFAFCFQLGKLIRVYIPFDRQMKTAWL